jgi:hypothetical protein
MNEAETPGSTRGANLVKRRRQGQASDKRGSLPTTWFLFMAVLPIILAAVMVLLLLIRAILSV